jgi:hypothetical protein
MFCSSLDGSFILHEGLAATVKSAPGCWVGEATRFRAGSQPRRLGKGLGARCKELRDGGVGVGCGVGNWGGSEAI